MFGQINWSRWTLLFVIVLTVALSNGTRLGRSQVCRTDAARAYPQR